MWMGQTRPFMPTLPDLTNFENVEQILPRVFNIYSCIKHWYLYTPANTLWWQFTILGNLFLD
jgi:hypothetical protein